MRQLVAASLAVIAIVTTVVLGNRARQWNDELALPSPPLASEPPRIDDPHTPRIAGRVVLVIIDGLGSDEADLPFLDELRQRGASAVAHVAYPTISRPSYVTILTGVPPRDSGVRANRVRTPVAVDTVMDRVQAAGLRVASASDFGSLASLFLRHTRTLGVELIDDGSRLTPPPPITWPFDEVRRAPSLAALGLVIAELAASDAAFIPVLALDVDRAGHAAGIGTEYRATAIAVDRMLRVAFAGIDLARDTVIVTADHGHVAPGGHGGNEREVSNVPLVLAGRGIVAGASARDPRSIDIAPTIAALLGVAAPAQAEGRTLVELLQLSPADAARRIAADATRGERVETVIAAARVTRPEPIRLALLAVGVAMTIIVALALRRAVAITPAALSGASALAVMLLATVAITHGQVSPSYVPSLARTQQLGAVAIVIAVVAQLVASWLVLRRARDRLATANGIALIGLALALGVVGIVRASFSPPHIDVPPPFWMVMVPALDLAAAACALAIAIMIAIATTRELAARSRPSST